MTLVEAVQRPNGTMYRPRKVVAYLLDDDKYDNPSAVVVLGTHDIERARTLANDLVRSSVDTDCIAVSPYIGWWSDGFRYGQRTFESDPDKGRAGVYFTEIVERTR